MQSLEIKKHYSEYFYTRRKIMKRINWIDRKKFFNDSGNDELLFQNKNAKEIEQQISLAEDLMKSLADVFKRIKEYERR